jgi:pyruvate,water dikinase
VDPLAAGIVERLGGMLIHRVIITREYSIPCVIGIPEATEEVATGYRLTVDGYFGIMVIDSRVGRSTKGLNVSP